MIKFVEKIEDANCITHDGTMHADEVFATAFLELYIKEVRIYRTTTININNFTDEIYIYDVGRGKYDHHQEDIKKRENGIPYSSLGLLWREYGKKFLQQEGYEEAEEMAKEIEKDLIEGIDAIDNGMFPKIESSYKVKTISDMIGLFNPSYQSLEEPTTQFLKAEAVAKAILKEEISRAKGKVIAKEKIKEQLKNVQNHTLLLEEYLPYEETLLSEDVRQEIYFVMFPSNRGGYAVKTVPKSSKERENRIDFPKEWAGLTEEELRKTSGIEGITFCHRNLFLIGCKTIESAHQAIARTLELARIKNKKI